MTKTGVLDNNNIRLAIQLPGNRGGGQRALAAQEALLCEYGLKRVLSLDKVASCHVSPLRR